MKAKVAWCKYCYTTHDKWWPVEGKPYWTCGICLHTSAEEFMDTEEEEDVKAKILSLGTDGAGSLVEGEEGEVRSARQVGADLSQVQEIRPAEAQAR